MVSKYIVFEGTDGSGKTTLADMIADLLLDTVVRTKEPGSPHIGLCVDIREEILNKASTKKDPITYAYLFAADTRIHMEKLVVPTLDAGYWVVSDRSVLSDFAYRPYYGDSIRNHNLHMFAKLNPIVFFIDVDPEEAARRMETREQELNEFEREHVLGKISEIRKAYLEHSHRRFLKVNEDLGHNAHEGNGVWYHIDNNHTLHSAYMQIVCYLATHFVEIRQLLTVGR